MTRDLLRGIALLILGGCCLFAAMSGMDTLMELYLSSVTEQGSEFAFVSLIHWPGALKVLGISVGLLITSIFSFWLSFKKLVRS